MPGEPVLSSPTVPWSLSARSAAGVAAQAERLASALDRALDLGVTFFDTADTTGSAAQLAMNLAGMIIAGVLTLVVQRLVWRHLSDAMRHRSSERWLRAQLGPSPTSPAAVATREH